MGLNYGVDFQLYIYNSILPQLLGYLTDLYEYNYTYCYPLDNEGFLMYNPYRLDKQGLWHMLPDDEDYPYKTYNPYTKERRTEKQ